VCWGRVGVVAFQILLVLIKNNRTSNFQMKEPPQKFIPHEMPLVKTKNNITLKPYGENYRELPLTLSNPVDNI